MTSLKKPLFSKIVRYGLLLGTCLCLCLFVASRIIPIIQGPRINLEQSPSITELSNPLIELSGKITNSKKVTVNGANLLVTPGGMFHQNILLNNGYNTITFEITDALGKRKTEQYAYVLNEQETDAVATLSNPIQKN
jgi:hypothetical protein